MFEYNGNTVTCTINEHSIGELSSKYPSVKMGMIGSEMRTPSTSIELGVEGVQNLGINNARSNKAGLAI